MTAELDRLEDSVEQYRVAISAEREMQFLFREFSGDTRVEVTVTLPHGYPNKAPVVTADPIEENCPHRWPNGALCLYGAVAVWNPGQARRDARGGAVPAVDPALHRVAADN